MTAPQFKLWVNRTLMHMEDAKKYGCRGLLGIDCTWASRERADLRLVHSRFTQGVLCRRHLKLRNSFFALFSRTGTSNSAFLSQLLCSLPSKALTCLACKLKSVLAVLIKADVTQVLGQLIFIRIERATFKFLSLRGTPNTISLIHWRETESKVKPGSYMNRLTCIGRPKWVYCRRQAWELAQ